VAAATAAVIVAGMGFKFGFSGGIEVNMALTDVGFGQKFERDIHAQPLLDRKPALGAGFTAGFQSFNNFSRTAAVDIHFPHSGLGADFYRYRYGRLFENVPSANFLQGIPVDFFKIMMHCVSLSFNFPRPAAARFLHPCPKAGY